MNLAIERNAELYPHVAQLHSNDDTDNTVETDSNGTEISILKRPSAEYVYALQIPFEKYKVFERQFLAVIVGFYVEVNRINTVGQLVAYGIEQWSSCASLSSITASRYLLSGNSLAGIKFMEKDQRNWDESSSGLKNTLWWQYALLLLEENKISLVQRINEKISTHLDIYSYGYANILTLWIRLSLRGEDWIVPRVGEKFTRHLKDNTVWGVNYIFDIVAFWLMSKTNFDGLSKALENITNYVECCAVEDRIHGETLRTGYLQCIKAMIHLGRNEFQPCYILLSEGMAQIESLGSSIEHRGTLLEVYYYCAAHVTDRARFDEFCRKNETKLWTTSHCEVLREIMNIQAPDGASSSHGSLPSIASG
eukprot:CAMPEP_0114977246 /NCGR_PEP_ID=MMETSP0216-20121206/3128_1 /TAXON_ID=223996 /ORGANISM="Protocruzia adherens, Strain Boccale" /LENGTH=364 /DNA_ID=CAMNT_0002338277 /DNA_START=417 /DNA_END=1511 /DNA_ORIENTATION=+